MNQLIENEEVQNIVHFKSVYKQIVQKLLQSRIDSGITQDSLSEWLGVDRRKIISFEKLKKVDLELLLKYADKFSFDINIKYVIN